MRLDDLSLRPLPGGASSSTVREEEPFIVQDRAVEEAASVLELHTKPGVPYITENPGGAMLCMSDPVTDERGRLTYPIAERYAHLPHLGQLFTAINCGPKRTEELPSIEEGMYTPGGTLWLKEKPSYPLQEVLKHIGYACVLNARPPNCTVWRLAGAVRSALLGELMPFVEEMERDA